MRKITYQLILLVLFALVIMPAGNGVAKVSKNDTEKWIRLGFSEDEIAELTPEEIEYFSDFDVVETVSDVTKYYHIQTDEKGKSILTEVDKQTALRESKIQNAKLEEINDEIIKLKSFT